jgi:hypothetical protein
MPGRQGGTPGATGGQGGGFQRPALPAGVTEEQARAVFQKRMSGETLTAADSALMARIRAARQAQGGAGGPGGGGAAPQGGTGAQPQDAAAGGTPDAGGPSLPPGVTREQVAAIFQKRMSGGTLTAAEQAIMNQLRARMGGGSGGGNGGGGGRRQFGANSNFQYGGSYIVFVLRNGQPTPVKVRTGFTDMDYSEVISGLTDKDTVLLLPSASLVSQQEDMKSRMARMSGGGVPGMTSQPAAAPRPGGGGGPGGPR